MHIEQLYTKCLAQGAYFIESNGEAAVIDPLRDETHKYKAMANFRGAKIKYIFETHFHADFVSGHIDLSVETGAPIIFGPGAKTAFESYVGNDGEMFRIGDLTLTLLHTPGHTLESCCYLLKDKQQYDVALFTGDTLFIGDVGRPDLAQKSDGSLTQQDLAGMLFDSLNEKIIPLPDHVVIYPAHGAGSACGKNMSSETFDTMGHQKETNYALNPELSREQFIKEVTTGITAPPGYFPMNVRLNSQGYDQLDKVLNRGITSLSVDEFSILMKNQGTVILDTRSPDNFAKGFINGSVNIGIDGNFAPWVGSLIPYSDNLLIVAEPGREKEVITRLARIGFDYALGFLDGGIEAWEAAEKPLKRVVTVGAETFLPLWDNHLLNVIDVRNEAEYNKGHLAGALHLPLGNIRQAVKALNRDKTYYVYCAGGYRSMIFISLLATKTDVQFVNIDGGYGAIEKIQQHGKNKSA